MPPRARPDADPKDLPNSSSRHHTTLGSSSAGAKRSRQNNGGSGTTTGAHRERDREREIAIAATTDNVNGNGNGAIGAPGIDWTTAPPHILHAYRHAYNVQIPSAFRSSLSAAVLTSPAGIGRYSPTMLGRRRAHTSALISNNHDNDSNTTATNDVNMSHTDGANGINAAAQNNDFATRKSNRERASSNKPAKTSKEALSLAVRKHFNSLAVSEADVVVEFLYRVKFDKRSLRWRFGGGNVTGGLRR